MPARAIWIVARRDAEDTIGREDKKMTLAPLREWFASDEDPNRLISIFDRMIKTYQQFPAAKD